ncbi:MATE family efflux transporter [Alkaliphilus metalliredigens]|uniref:MATE family efflux transporter n=1 Tax=Alkaliphilus metalliredigens TaxID=208226 RepID=UPI00030FFBC1|nr:MATE family efflux transporter [Alkaliphilus metalliredigens]
MSEALRVERKQIRKIWDLAWPVMMAQLLHTLMSIVDMWFVANLGDVEAAAAGTSTSFIGVIHVIPFLIATGTIAIVARLSGQENHESIASVAKQSMFLAMTIGIMVQMMAFLNLDSILKIFGNADLVVMTQAKLYITIVLVGIPLFFFNAATKALLQATGDTRTPLIIFVIMNLLNIALDYTFIIKLSWGIAGAAWATTISESVGFILMVALIYKRMFKGRGRASIGSFRIHGETCIRILKIGSFSAVQMMTRPVTGLIIYGIVLSQGVEAGAAFGIGGRLFNFVFIVLMGLGTATSVLVGQGLGKKDFDEVEGIVKQGLKLSAYNMILFAIPYFILPHLLIQQFSENQEVIRIGMQYLRICYMGVVFVIFPHILGGAFSGAGDTFPPMFASLVGNWGVKIPLAYGLTRIWHLETMGIWIAISLSVIVEGMIVIHYYKRGRWKQKVF